MYKTKKNENRLYRLEQKKIAFRKLGDVCALCAGDRYKYPEDKQSNNYLQIDHIVPVRRTNQDLRRESGDNLIRKINKLSYAEAVRDYQLLCLLCHVDKTKKDREQNYLSDFDFKEETKNHPVQGTMF